MIRTLAILFLSTAVAFSQGAARRVETVADLLRVNPYSVATAGKLTVSVAGMAAGKPWAERFASWSSTRSLQTNIGTVFNSPFGGQWVFNDRLNPIHQVEWYGAFGAKVDPENLLNEQDSSFSDSSTDSSWTGYGDGNRVITGSEGSGATYGVFTFPTSPSAYGSNRSLLGYSREPGISTIPPGGTLSLRLTRRGHGYTNVTESVTVVETDGTNTPLAFIVQIGQGLRDGFFDAGGFKIVLQPSSTANQFMKLSYYGTTNSPVGGLRAPLVVGKTYYYSVVSYRASGAERVLYFGTSDSARGTFTPTLASSTYTGSFVADGTELRLGLVGSDSAGEVFHLDDISLTEGVAVADPDDEGAAIAAAIDGVGSGTVLFPASKKFVSSRGFVLRQGQTISGSGSTLKINVGTSRSDGIQIFGEGSTIENLRIDYSADVPTENEGEGSQSIIGLGHFQYTDYPQAGNVSLRNLKLYGGGRPAQGANAILIGGAYNVTANTIYIHGHTNLFNAIGIYWSGYNVQSVGTVHPKNIILQNINIGAMNNTNGNGASAISISAATGILVQNLEALSTSGNFIRVIPGDIGFQQAKSLYGGLSQAGIMFDNVRCSSVGRYGIRLQNIIPFQVDETTPFIAENVPVEFDLDKELVSWPGYTNRAVDGALVRFSGTLPTGLIDSTNYWVTWSSPAGFKVRAGGDGSGNGDVIDLSGSYTNVTVKVWNAHMNTIGPMEVRGLQIIGTGAVYDGILADGCDGLLVHGQSSVSGFRNGAWIETYTPNYNVIFRDVSFFDNHNSGVYVPAGYNIVVEGCKIFGNGVSGSGDTATGIRVTGGSGHKLINNQIGRPDGEIIQGAGIKIDNDKPTLEWVVMEDNKVYGATTPSAFVLNTVAPTNLWTFSRVIGNTFVPSATLTNAWQEGASAYPFPVLTASALDSQKFTIAKNYAASLWVQRLEIGANANITGRPGDFNRTANTEKNGIIQIPSYNSGVGSSAQPVQMIRMLDVGSSARLSLGAGEGGGLNKGATVVDLRTVASTNEGAAQTIAFEADAFGRSAVGPGANGRQDSATSVSFVGGLPVRLPRLSTNGLSIRDGHMAYDTNRARAYWADTSNWVPMFSLSEYTDLTDSGDSSLHYHSSDRNRASHTGTQAFSTLTGLPTTLAEHGITNGATITDLANHVAAADPHPNYVLESSGNATNLSVHTALTLDLGSDLASGGSHRALVRDASTGNMRTMTASYFKGWLDIEAADISDAGAKGRLLLQSATTANALDELGTGRSGSLFLRGDGAWATPPTGAPGTNGIPDAPNDGTAYVRKSEAWTGLDIGDATGMTAFGLDWIETTTDDIEALDKLGLTGSGVATIDSPATHVSRINSSGSGTARHRNNFIAGTGIGLALTDDSVSDEADVTVSLADGDRGDYTVSSGTATIDAGAVSYSKIQSVTASRLLGRGDSGAGAPQELTAGAGLAISGTTVSVDPSTFISGQVLYVAAEEVSLSGTDFTDESWHNVAGTAKTGTSKTIAAGALGSGTVLKIEMAGEFQYEDSAVMDLRVTIGGLTMTFDWNEVYVEDADSASPWNAVVYVTVKTSGASATVRSSGYLDWTTLTSLQPNVNYQFKCKATQSGTLDTTGSNLIGVDFYGTDSAGPQFNAFTLNQVIVTRL